MRYAAFVDLGRTTMADLDNTTFDASGIPTHVGTNQIGRYPIHFHHVRGSSTPPANGYQFTLIGCAVDGGSAVHNFKWGIAVHNSHYGLIKDDVVYNMDGSGILTEDGSESFNRFENNMVTRVMGTGGRASEDEVANPRGNGREGSAFWFRGPNNYMSNNVATNVYVPYGTTGVYAYGYILSFYRLGNINVPAFPGADTSDPNQVVVKHGNNLPFLDFTGNEAYGAMQSGMTLWWAGTEDSTFFANAQETLIKDFMVWNFWAYGFFMYPVNRVTIDGLKIRGDYALLAENNGSETGLLFSDYFSRNLVIKNADIEGVNSGLGLPVNTAGVQTVQDSRIRAKVGITYSTPWSVSYRSDGLPPTKKIIKNVKKNNKKFIGVLNPVSYLLECCTRLQFRW
jgi:hypothetical protein